MKKALWGILLVVFAAASCTNKPIEEVKVQEVALAAPSATADQAQDMQLSDPGVKSIEKPSPNSENAAETTAKKIIKEGEISFETGNLKNTRKALVDTLQRLGGYIDEEKQDNSSYQQRKNYTLIIRIPVQNFEHYLSAVSSAADRIESKSIRVKDVTTEFIDITTRLNNKKLLENRYKELLQKSAKMADILEVENKLNEIRTDIETTQGQLNYLNKQIAYSSLNVTFFTETISGNNEGNGFGYKFKMALSESWQLLQSIFFGLITAWPIIILAIVSVIFFRRWMRKRRDRQL